MLPFCAVLCVCASRFCSSPCKDAMNDGVAGALFHKSLTHSAHSAHPPVLIPCDSNKTNTKHPTVPDGQDFPARSHTYYNNATGYGSRSQRKLPSGSSWKQGKRTEHTEPPAAQQLSVKLWQQYQQHKLLVKQQK